MDTKYRIMAMTLVNRLIESGSPIYAISNNLFIVTDIDLPEEVDARISEVMKTLEPNDPLRSPIVEYLRELGRDMGASSPADDLKPARSSLHYVVNKLCAFLTIGCAKAQRVDNAERFLCVALLLSCDSMAATRRAGIPISRKGQGSGNAL